MAYHKGEMDSALVYLEKALISWTQQEEFLGQAKCHLILGWISEGAGFWEQAKGDYCKTIQLTQSANCKETGLAYLGIARCKQILKESVRDEIEMGISCLRATGKKEFALYADFSGFMFGDKNEEAANHLKSVADEYMSLKLGNNAASVYKLLARYCMNQGQLDSSKEFLDKAIGIYDESYSQISLMPGLKQFKGVLFFQEKDYEQSRQSLLESIKWYDKLGKEGQKYFAYKYLYRIDTLQGNYQRAIYYQSRAFESFKTARYKEKQLMAKVAEVDVKVLLMRQTIDRLEYTNKMNGILYCSAIVLILLVLLVIFQLIRGRYRNEQQREQERTRQFQNLLVGLGEKRLLQQRIAESSDVISSDPVLSASLSDDFSVCYIETIREFGRSFSQLSDTEIRYAVMFALNLSGDVISEIQNVQMAAIRKVKQRIRQKLELDNDRSLELYFQQFLKTEAYAELVE
ncbi:MAG: hypothetical protein JEZ14_14220 [Marinilabiliaceae bacterium]|nr:hypothetical protein [Marinilabiliaceae bacterium]